MRKVSFSVQAKITLLFLMLSLLMIAAVSSIDFFYSTNDLEKRILSDLVAISRAKAANIKVLIEEDFEDAADLAGRLTIRQSLADIEYGTGDYKKASADILASIQSAQGASRNTIREVTIIDASGRVVVATRPESLGNDLSESVFFLKGREGIYLGIPRMYQGVLVYEIAVPIYPIDPEESGAIGVVRVMIDATRLLDILIDYSGLGATGETVLGQRRGDAILFLGPLRHCENLKAKLRVPIRTKRAEPMRLAISRRTGFVTGTDYRGKEVLAAYYYIPVSDWGVVVKMDKEEAFRPINDLGFQIILVSSLLFLMSALAIMHLAEYLTAPIKQLQEGMKVIAGGDLDFRVRVDTADEVGDLAGSLNDMTEHLQKITVSVDRLNREVEERKRAEGDLSEALKVKSNFIQTISHEIRTPLAAVREGINIVLDGISGPINDEQKGFLMRTRTNVERLTRLINEILDFQKLESGKMAFAIEENDLNRIAQDVFDTMSPLAAQRGLTLTIALDNAVPRIRCDKDRIAQVFMNIVDNAIKFTERGTISIHTLKEGEAIHVVVRDSGRGINPHDMPRLFRSFEQLGRLRDRKGGTGLGLVISKDIIEFHGGSIWAESEPGKGSVFHFILPIHGKAQV